MKTLLLKSGQLASLFKSYDNGERGFSLNKLHLAATFVRAVVSNGWIEALDPDGNITDHRFWEIELVILPAYKGNEGLYGGSEKLVKQIIDEMAYKRHLFAGLLDYAEDERSRSKLEELGVGVCTTEAELYSAIRDRSLNDLLVSLANKATPAMEAVYNQPWVKRRQAEERQASESALAAERELAQATRTPWNLRTPRMQDLIDRYEKSQRRMRGLDL